MSTVILSGLPGRRLFVGRSFQVLFAGQMARLRLMSFTLGLIVSATTSSALARPIRNHTSEHGIKSTMHDGAASSSPSTPTTTLSSASTAIHDQPKQRTAARLSRRTNEFEEELLRRGLTTREELAWCAGYREGWREDIGHEIELDP